jgi:hypothetical protein
MRTLIGGAPAKVAQKCGTEPMTIVEIQWVDGGARFLYADRKIANSAVVGQITSIGSIDSTVTDDTTTDSTQVTLTLDDTDGKIKVLCDTYDLHKRPVWIYQWFSGLSISDKFLLFKGEMNSPFIWGEGDVTVTFTVTSKIEDTEAGFSMEEGDFPTIPADALGKVWPLCFGSVCDVAAVQVRSPRKGILQSGEGIHDYTLESRICQARYLQCANVALGTETTITNDYVPQYDPNTGLLLPSTDNTTVTKTQAWGPDQTCVEDAYNTICDLLHQLTEQKTYEHSTILIKGGIDFPQHIKVTLNINGGKFTGSFSGEVFTILSREHPDYAINPPSICKSIGCTSYTAATLLSAGDWVQNTDCDGGASWYNGLLENGANGGTNADPTDVADFCDPSAHTSQGNKSDGGPAASQKALDDMVTASFFWAQAGSEVYLEGEAEVLYIANLLPCTITRIAAIKNTSQGSKLITVPSSYYTIYETDYDGYTVTEIGMTQLLSQRNELIINPDGTKRVAASKWSDGLYITLTSTIGPNPVDIIQWLVEKYTSYTVDPTTFALVKIRLTNYPSNFALTKRENVMTLIGEIAHQSRCLYYVRNDVVYLKYYSATPTPEVTITESDIIANTLDITLTDTTKVYTKHKITWKKSDYEGDLDLILKLNTAKYGTSELDTTYNTQNIYDNILKSSTFWLIRDANMWKQVEFSTPLHLLALEVFDCVTLNLASLSTSPVLAVITAVNYDVGNEQIKFTCWTPLKSGSTLPYLFAWPAFQSRKSRFPTAEETAAGLGYDFTVAPPVGHLLYQPTVAPDGQTTILVSQGDPYPSDLDDTLSLCFCPTADDAVVEEPDPVFTALLRAQRADQTAKNTETPTGASGGGGNQNKKKKKDNGCQCTSSVDDPLNNSCMAIVSVLYSTAELVRHGCGGRIGCGYGPGANCMGSLFTWCYTMGSSVMATTFASRIAAKMHVPTACSDCDSGDWNCGDTKPYCGPTIVICGNCAFDTHGKYVGQGDTRAPTKGP